MSRQGRPGSFHHQFSRDHEGFQRLGTGQGGDTTVDIPMQDYNNMSAGQQDSAATVTEKTTFFHQPGMRKSARAAASKRAHFDADGEETAVTKMGLIYRKILGLSVVMRWITYIVPVGLAIAVPIIVGATASQNADIGGVRIVWFFTWIECCWLGLWVSKIFAHFLPRVFTSVVGVVSAGTRKYALVIKALEIPLSLVGWALVSLATFIPLMRQNPDTRAQRDFAEAHNKPFPKPYWQSVVQRILAAAMISSLIFLGERAFIQIISINYHRKQFTDRIKQSKHDIWLLGLLYDASRAMFPTDCPEFEDEDAIIADLIDLGHHKKGPRHARSGSSTPMRLLQNIGRARNKITSVFGHVAHEVTGKQTFDPESAHAVVVEALEKNKSCEALAKRLWLSFVVEGNDALYYEDVHEVLGPGREAEAEECFSTLDKDANGSVTLDEMILTVTQFGRDRHSIATSMHDVDQAINVLDRMLCVVIFIVVIFIFIAFLNESFVTTLATTGTALLSLSFIFSVSAQEILGSCIFLFVKHPYDIGDRVDLTTGTDQFVVEHISLLFTVFRRVTNHRMVQIPNILLNTLWIENVSRSKAMREQITINCAFETSLEDIQLLRSEMVKFATDKENSRDFFPEIEIEVLDLGSMDQMQLQIEAKHKSNWANETVRSARRSKFMCALVLALKRVPIYGPAGGDPALGAFGNPSFSVSISDQEANKRLEDNERKKDQARLYPLRPAGKDAADQLETISEEKVMGTLNERSPALDGTRDEGHSRAEGLTSTRDGSQPQALEEVRGLLRRETTKGKRKSPQVAGYHAPSASTSAYQPPSNTYQPPSSTSTAAEPQQGIPLGQIPTTQVPPLGLAAPPVLPAAYPMGRSPGSVYAADRGGTFLDEWQRGTEREVDDEYEHDDASGGEYNPPFGPPRHQSSSTRLTGNNSPVQSGSPSRPPWQG